VVGGQRRRPAKSGDMSAWPGRRCRQHGCGASLHHHAADGRIMIVEPNREGARVRRATASKLQFRAKTALVLPQDAA